MLLFFKILLIFSYISVLHPRQPYLDLLLRFFKKFVIFLYLYVFIFKISPFILARPIYSSHPHLRKKGRGWDFLKILSKTMYKIYDFLINFTEIFLFPPLYLDFAPMYNTSKNIYNTPKSNYTGYANWGGGELWKSQSLKILSEIIYLIAHRNMYIFCCIQESLYPFNSF